MLTDFEYATAQIHHRASKGREREVLVVKKFLDRYLPSKAQAIHGAEILDSTGNRSFESDIVIQDPNTPPLYAGESFRLIPAEWALGIIEVKSKLDGPELVKAQQNISHAKALRKATYIPQGGDITWGLNAYGQRFEYFPMYGVIFAYKSIGLQRLASKLMSLQDGIPIERWVDIVVVLDKGLLLYSDPTNRTRAGSVRPSPGCELRPVFSEHPLVPATLAIQTAFNAVFHRDASLGPYLGPEPWGTFEPVSPNK